MLYPNVVPDTVVIVFTTKLPELSKLKLSLFDVKQLIFKLLASILIPSVVFVNASLK